MVIIDRMSPVVNLSKLITLLVLTTIHYQSTNGNPSCEELRKIQCPADTILCPYYGNCCKKATEVCSSFSQTCEPVFKENEDKYSVCCKILFTNDTSRVGLIEACKYQLGSHTWLESCKDPTTNGSIPWDIIFSITIAVCICESAWIIFSCIRTKRIKKQKLKKRNSKVYVLAPSGGINEQQPYQHQVSILAHPQSLEDSAETTQALHGNEETQDVNIHLQVNLAATALCSRAVEPPQTTQNEDNNEDADASEVPGLLVQVDDDVLEENGDLIYH